MLNQHATSVTGQRFRGANPVAEIKPAASAMSFGYRVTVSRYRPEL
jgi:hypothetical protein